MSRFICLCGGGTGGHLVPNLAVYQELERCGWLPYFLIPNNSFDLDFCSQKGLRYKKISYGKLVSGSPLFVAWKILYSILQVGLIFLKDRPRSVLGTGGYGSFPVYICAVLWRLPLFILEPNRICGKVNRWFAPFARAVFTSEMGTERIPRLKNLIRTGNPLPYKCIEPTHEGECLLVFGASQGASSINRFIDNWLRRLGEELPVLVVWITGRGEFSQYRSRRLEGKIEVYDYLNDMEFQYRRATLALTRAGAGTISELKTFRIPAVLVPYPHHQDRQQYLNAGELIQSGACLLKEETDLDLDSGNDFLPPLLRSGAEIKRMREAFPPILKPDEVRTRIVERILNC